MRDGDSLISSASWFQSGGEHNEKAWPPLVLQGKGLMSTNERSLLRLQD